MKLRSENIAGILAFIGSCLVILIGDVQSLAATALFLTSNGFFIFRGHTRAGYSLAAIALAIGYYILAFSSAGSEMPVFWSLMILGNAWTFAACRWPFYRFGQTKLAEALPTAVGVIVTMVRVPAIIAVAMAGQWILLIAMLLWTVADLLAGRVQEACAVLIKSVKKGK